MMDIIGRIFASYPLLNILLNFHFKHNHLYSILDLLSTIIITLKLLSTYIITFYSLLHVLLNFCKHIRMYSTLGLLFTCIITFYSLLHILYIPVNF